MLLNPSQFALIAYGVMAVIAFLVAAAIKLISVVVQRGAGSAKEKKAKADTEVSSGQ